MHRAGVIHRSAPLSQFREVPVDPRVARLQVVGGTDAALVRPQVEVLDQVVNQVIASIDEILQCGLHLDKPVL